jgi:hypothetical protein
MVNGMATVVLMAAAAILVLALGAIALTITGISALLSCIKPAARLTAPGVGTNGRRETVADYVARLNRHEAHRPAHRSDDAQGQRRRNGRSDSPV